MISLFSKCELDQIMGDRQHGESLNFDQTSNSHVHPLHNGHKVNNYLVYRYTLKKIQAIEFC